MAGQPAALSGVGDRGTLDAARGPVDNQRRLAIRPALARADLLCADTEGGTTVISMSRRGLLGRTGLLGGPFAVATEGSSSLRTDEVRQERGKLKVVVTGGHPGDPEYGCGGTIARYADLGHEVVLLYLNDGEPAGQKPPGGVHGTRIAEAAKACEILGARPLYAGQVDGEAVVDAAHYAAFRKVLEAERPDVVFTHWPIDNHADHRAISMLVYDAWLRMGRRFALYYYEVSNGEDTVQFAPTHYVDITADRAAEAPGLLRTRQPGPGQVLRAARAGDPAPRDRAGRPASGGLHPPHPEPGFLAAARVVMDSSSHGRPAEVPFPRQ